MSPKSYGKREPLPACGQPVNFQMKMMSRHPRRGHGFSRHHAITGFGRFRLQRQKLFRWSPTRTQSGHLLSLLTLPPFQTCLQGWSPRPNHVTSTSSLMERSRGRSVSLRRPLTVFPLLRHPEMFLLFGERCALRASCSRS